MINSPGLDDQDIFEYKQDDHPLGPTNVFKQLTRLAHACGLFITSYAIYKGHVEIWPGVFFVCVMWFFFEFFVVRDWRVRQR